ncbi:MAG: 4-hydroxy-tetrahydrodipicolinate reductase, partial [Oscillospiraceae bacterium]
MINVILSGANGKMGRVIENCIAQRDDMQIICGVDINTTKYAEFPIYSTISDCLFFDVQRADVVIDFSHPNALEKTLEYCFQNNVALVAATTGYTNEQIEQIKNAAKKIPVFFTFNMSLGINLLIELAKKATAVLGDQFDIEIVEKHHNQKIDAPSGTAIMLANEINQTANNTYNYEY